MLLLIPKVAGKCRAGNIDLVKSKWHTNDLITYFPKTNPV